MDSTKRGYPKICTVLYWGSVWQDGYSYPKQIARQHGRPCKIFTRIEFDHHAQVRCCFSYCVDSCRRAQRFGRRWGPPPWKGAVADRL